MLEKCECGPVSSSSSTRNHMQQRANTKQGAATDVELKYVEMTATIISIMNVLYHRYKKRAAVLPISLGKDRWRAHHHSELNGC